MLSILKIRVTSEHVRGIVGVQTVVCGVIDPCKTWSMPHITLIKQWDCISIPVASSLDHYTTDEQVHCSGASFCKPG